MQTRYGSSGKARARGLLQKATGVGGRGSFYSRHIGAFGPEAEGAGRKTASVGEEERRESAEGRCFHRGCCPQEGEDEEQKQKISFDFLYFHVLLDVNLHLYHI